MECHAFFSLNSNSDCLDLKQLSTAFFKMVLK